MKNREATNRKDRTQISRERDEWLKDLGQRLADAHAEEMTRFAIECLTEKP